MIKISPSIASSDLLHVADNIRFIDENFQDIHIDIEDGVYLPNISFGFKLAKAICRESSSTKSLHIMVHDPLFWISDIKECKPDRVFIHVDHVKDPASTLQTYKDAGIPVGLGLSNRDLNRDILPLLAFVDKVLVLTAVIEDAQQQYKQELERFAGRLVNSRREVWVDGGIKHQNLSRLSEMGIYTAVMGRAVFCDKPPMAD